VPLLCAIPYKPEELKQKQQSVGTTFGRVAWRSLVAGKRFQLAEPAEAEEHQAKLSVDTLATAGLLQENSSVRLTLVDTLAWVLTIASAGRGNRTKMQLGVVTFEAIRSSLVAS
jgi:hypothetical protein